MKILGNWNKNKIINARYPMYIAFIFIAFTLGLQGCSGDSDSGDSDENKTSQENTPPSLQGASVEYTRTGKFFSFKPDATDADNDILTFSIENKPAWAMFDTATGELSGQPDGQDVQQYYDIIISVSDGKGSATLPPFILKVLHAEIGESNVTIDPAATVTTSASGNGYNIVGKAAIKVGDLVTEFNDADLDFTYDGDGKLLDIEGETELPTKVSDNLAIGAGVRAIIGLYTGAEINASMDIGPDSEPGIRLRDEFRYLVYFLDAGASLTFKNSDGTEELISLDLAGTRTLIITDPTDPFFYYFGEVAGLAVGFGYSFNNNIPWEPLFDPAGETAFAELEPFLGGAVLKGTFPISAFKVFDALELKGFAVCRPSQLIDCSKPTPVGLVASLAKALIVDGGIDPTQQIKLGINGSAAVKFGILGIDLFEYKLLDISSMIDIGTEREKLAIQGVIETNESVQPSWIPFKPVPDPGAIMVANLFADVDTNTGEGDFGMSLYGEIDSDFPLARMNGSININPRGLQMTGFIDDPVNPITVSAIVDADKLEASILFSYDINANVNLVVNNALDTAIDEVNQVFDDLQNDIGNYNIAFTLDGFRTQLPNIVLQAKGRLDSIPGTVYTTTYNKTRDGINNHSYVYTSPIGTKTTFRAKNYISATGVARSVATSARNTAQAKVNARKAQLDELRAQAEEAQDGPAFRTALKNALLTVAANDKYSQPVKITRTIKFKIAGITVATREITFYNSTFNFPIIDTPTKNRLIVAANNVDNIEPSYNVMINTQQIFDAIPKEDIIEETRASVTAGVTALPVFNGAGYTMTRGLEQSVFVLLGDDRIEISFNPLDPASVVDNIGSLMAKQILP